MDPPPSEALIALILSLYWTEWLRELPDDVDPAGPEIRRMIEGVVVERRLARAGGIEPPGFKRLSRRRRR